MRDGTLKFGRENVSSMYRHGQSSIDDTRDEELTQTPELLVHCCDANIHDEENLIQLGRLVPASGRDLIAVL